MELFFVTVIGACIGAIVRYTLPQRHAYGAFLLPAIGAIVAAVVWVALLWAGLTFDGTWIWVAAVGASILAPVVVAVLLPRRRAESDARLLEKLSHS
ncbi:MAG: hypothetical protein ACOH19_14460 [Rhodoglobus sp.]